MLILKYDRKNFFGEREYTEDSTSNITYDAIKKSFRALKGRYDNTIQIDNTVIFWGSISDYNNQIINVRIYDEAHNYTEQKVSFDVIKKQYYKMYKED